MKKKVILVVDNNPVFLKLMSDFLEKKGHEVVTALDGLHALEILKTTKPDIVFIDLVMPNIRGSKICRIIRSKPEFDDVFLIVLSATALEEESEILFACNADAFIAKGPFKELSKHISHAIENFDKKNEDPAPKKIIGTDGVYSRQVTKELLTLLRHRDFVVNNMSEGIIEFTKNNKIIYLNKQALSILNVKEEEVLGGSFIDMFSSAIPKEIEENILSNYNKYLNEKITTYINNKYVVIDLIAVDVDKRKSYVAILKDITEQALADQAILESERKYRDLFENSSDIIQSIT